MAHQPVVLLIGRSLTLAAIAAGLSNQPALAVRQVDAWAPLSAAGQAAPDAVIVDGSPTAPGVAALLATYPRVLLLEVGASAAGDLQVTVHRNEQRPLGNGHDLVTLILDYTLAVAAQSTGAPPGHAATAAGAAPAQQTQDLPSAFSRSVP